MQAEGNLSGEKVAKVGREGLSSRARGQGHSLLSDSSVRNTLPVTVRHVFNHAVTQAQMEGQRV